MAEIALIYANNSRSAAQSSERALVNDGAKPIYEAYSPSTVRTSAVEASGNSTGIMAPMAR